MTTAELPVHPVEWPQAISALRDHLAEYGLIAPQGAAHLARLKAALE